MGLTITNPEIERLARTLALLRGQSVEQALGDALRDCLDRTAPPPSPVTVGRPFDDRRFDAAVQQLQALHKAVGPVAPVTRDDYDALWDR